MKGKHVALWLVVGWLVALVFPPSSLMGIFRGVTSQGS